MQRVKRRFFAMRNGALAQQMASFGGRKYQINFGLNLPQISEIAHEFLPGGAEYTAIVQEESFDSAEFARKLRDNRSTRESMLIAPMLFPVEKLTLEEALDWTRSALTPEVADILCMKLLRNFPEAHAVAGELLSGRESPIAVYTGLRLLLNLLQIGKTGANETEEMLQNSMEKFPVDTDPLTRGVCRQLREEIEFYRQG